jgi:hypothetical protein
MVHPSLDTKRQHHNTTFQDFVHADNSLVLCEVQGVDEFCDQMDTNTDGENDNPNVATIEGCRPFPICHKAVHYL